MSANLHWFIAAVIAPVPIFHLWLHALLPWWKKHPLLFYALGIASWIASFFFFKKIALQSTYIFFPAQNAQFFGNALIFIGIAAIVSSIIALGPKRFFVWTVLRPESAPKIRITKGPFHFIPHPAYIGYLIAAFGNLLAGGKFYLALFFISLLVLTPLVILLEEEELKKRLA